MSEVGPFRTFHTLFLAPPLHTKKVPEPVQLAAGRSPHASVLMRGGGRTPAPTLCLGDVAAHFPGFLLTVTVPMELSCAGRKEGSRGGAWVVGGP